jgi:hypothetical protein
MEIVLIVFVSILIASFFSITGMAVVAHIVGAGVTQVSYFFGPILFKIPGTIIVVRAIPMGGSVSTSRADNLSRPARVFCQFSGSLLIIIIAAIFMGSINQSLAQFFSGFSQIIRGAISPINEAQIMLARFNKLSYFEILGIVSCKFAAFDMFPILPLSGGNIVATIVNANKSAIEKLSILGFCFLLLIYISWLIAIIYFIIKQV